MFNVNDVLKCAGLLLNMRGSDHPIIDNCRDLLFGGMTSYRNTGTLVSLFNKLKRKGTASVDDTLVRANYERVVKASEMQHIMQALHSSTLTTLGGEKEEDVVLGNKLAVLVGDLFLTLAFKEITDIQDNTVLETFSKGVELFARPDFEETPRRPSIDWWEKCNAEKRSWFASAFECSVLVAGLRDLLFGGVTSYRNTGTLVSLFNKLKRKGTASVDDTLVQANYERVVKASEMQHIMGALHSSTLTTLSGEKEEDVVLGNKLAVLVGDLFLTLAFKEITDIQDNNVLETFSKGVELFARPDFEETPRRPSIDWWEKCNAEKRSWLASAFECSVLVAGLRCDDEREAARKCGRNLVLAMQVRYT
ncbi:hypothetical protein HPB47_026767 [Ixodes persulcatus]|uniref:Uncharacterized protein n=1 Tax=Ixodes persulcatus TaxID=34615 RepID=A0AC60PXR5_IXOPE|nr:hypothetical protein HPB47_026767 [Ixodes persulcatus]